MLSIKGGFVYIVTNQKHTVLYVGVTNKLKQRIIQHREKHFAGFTSRYKCDKLVYYAGFPFIAQAIAEEKRIKAGNRRKKMELIDSINPKWKDLWEEFSTWEEESQF